METNGKESSDFDEKRWEEFQLFLDGETESFDMYARDPKDTAWVKEYVPSLEIVSAGGMLPIQSEGTIYGYPYYYRERGGGASLTVSENRESPWNENILYSSYMSVPEFRSGLFFVETLFTLIEKLERSPFPYLFEGQELIWEGDKVFAADSLTTNYGWGHTPEEAFHNLITPIPEDPDYKYSLSIERQEEFIALQQHKPTPVNKDERVFPEIAPNFTIVGIPDKFRCPVNNHFHFPYPEEEIQPNAAPRCLDCQN